MNKYIAEYLWLTLKYRQCMPFFMNLIKDAGSISAVYDRTEFTDMPYLRYLDITLLRDKSFSKAEQTIESCIKDNIDIITYFDEAYPKKLREIQNPPLVLYVKGNICSFDSGITVSVVGARNAIESSRRITEEITADLSRHDVKIVSGLAYGIDSVAHKEALKRGGKTAAFLAGGLDSVYPSEHYELAQYVMSSGGLISEYPPGVRSVAENFNPRNRLISGVSDGVLVVQAGYKSGTKLTVDHACDQNKDLFVVPGDVYLFGLSNDLIKQGAKPVTNALDILEEYIGVFSDKIEQPKTEKTVMVHNDRKKFKAETASSNIINTSDLIFTKNEKQLLNIIKESDEISLDDIIRCTDLAPAVCISVLSSLEIKDYIVKSNGVYRIK